MDSREKPAGLTRVLIVSCSFAFCVLSVACFRLLTFISLFFLFTMAAEDVDALAPRLANVATSGATVRPVEAIYQDEFYRSIHHVLGYSMGVTSGWSWDGRGWIDFRVSSMRWEWNYYARVIDSVKIAKGFTSSGSYSSWIEESLLQDLDNHRLPHILAETIQ